MAASSSSAGKIAGSEQMLIEILLRLPLKSLIKFKLVSKQWQVLISSPYFAQLHHQLRPNPSPCLLLRAAPSRFFYFNPRNKKFLPYHFPFSRTKLLQSCNGLLLLKCSAPETANSNFLIYNPITRQSRKIELLMDEKNKSTIVLGFGLAFDPSKSMYYQVLCLRTTEYSVYTYRIEVYDSKTCNWKRWGDFVLPHDTNFSNGVYWKNCINWIRPAGESFHFNLQDGSIEKRNVVLPNCIWPRTNTLLTESNGHLHLVLLLLLSKLVSVWEMQDDNNGWFLKYNFSLNMYPEALFGTNSRVISVLDIIRGEGENDSTLVIHEPGKIMAYRSNNQSLDVLVDLRMEDFYEPGKLQFGQSDAYQFIETLAPV